MKLKDLINKNLHEILSMYDSEKRPHNIITDFSQKKVIEYLEDGADKILIFFTHGVGDTVMFLPVIDKLRKKYPSKIIDILLDNGQEECFGSIKDYSGIMKDYQFVFIPQFPWVCNAEITKGQFSAEHEVGLKIGSELSKIEYYESPIVLVHFQSTSCSDIYNCNVEVAKKIWNEIIDFGKIPMEVHYLHNHYNSVNQKFDFIDNNVRMAKATVPSLIGLIQNSYALLGVISGPMHISASINKERTACLMREDNVNHYSKFSKENIIDVDKYEEGAVYKWLEKLHEKDRYRKYEEELQTSISDTKKDKECSSINDKIKMELWRRYGDKEYPSEWDGNLYGGGKISQRFWEYFKVIEIMNVDENSVILDIGGGTGFFSGVLKDFVKEIIIIDPLVNEVSNYENLKKIFRKKIITHVISISTFEHIPQDILIENIKAINDFFNGEMFICTSEYHPNVCFFENQLTVSTMNEIFTYLNSFYLSHMERTPIPCVNSFAEGNIPQWYPILLGFKKNREFS